MYHYILFFEAIIQVLFLKSERVFDVFDDLREQVVNFDSLLHFLTAVQYGGVVSSCNELSNS